MNKYARRILKRLSKAPHTLDELADIHCHAIVATCLQELEEDKKVMHVTESYVVDPDKGVTDEKVDSDQWIISLKGLDYLADRRRDFMWKSLPIVISFSALIIAVIKI